MDSEFFQETNLCFPSHYWKQAWEVLHVSFWVSEFKRCHIWQAARSLLPRRNHKPGVLLLKKTCKAMPSSIMPTKSDSTHSILASKSPATASLICELPTTFSSFFLNVRLHLIWLNIFAQGGRIKSCCKKGASPLMFQ